MGAKPTTSRLHGTMGTEWRRVCVEKMGLERGEVRFAFDRNTTAVLKYHRRRKIEGLY